MGLIPPLVSATTVVQLVNLDVERCSSQCVTVLVLVFHTNLRSVFRSEGEFSFYNCEALRIFLHFVFWENSIIEKGFLQYHVDYNIGPFSFNLIILALSFSLSLKFNVITLLGILVGWYYFKYSY